jgi:hypothetical protein
MEDDYFAGRASGAWCARVAAAFNAFKVACVGHSIFRTRS